VPVFSTPTKHARHGPATLLWAGDYGRLAGEWNAWNATTLPESPTSSTDNFTGAEMADHIRTKRVTADRDPELP